MTARPTAPKKTDDLNALKHKGGAGSAVFIGKIDDRLVVKGKGGKKELSFSYIAAVHNNKVRMFIVNDALLKAQGGIKEVKFDGNGKPVFLNNKDKPIKIGAVNTPEKSAIFPAGVLKITDGKESTVAGKKVKEPVISMAAANPKAMTSLRPDRLKVVNAALKPVLKDRFKAIKPAESLSDLMQKSATKKQSGVQAFFSNLIPSIC